MKILTESDLRRFHNPGPLRSSNAFKADKTVKTTEHGND